MVKSFKQFKEDVNKSEHMEFVESEIMDLYNIMETVKDSDTLDELLNDMDGDIVGHWYGDTMATVLDDMYWDEQSKRDIQKRMNRTTGNYMMIHYKEDEKQYAVTFMYK